MLFQTGLSRTFPSRLFIVLLRQGLCRFFCNYIFPKINPQRSKRNLRLIEMTDFTDLIPPAQKCARPLSFFSLHLLQPAPAHTLRPLPKRKMSFHCFEFEVLPMFQNKVQNENSSQTKKF